MTTMTEPGTTTQVYQLYIKASQEEVWEAITDPVIVSRFFLGQVREATYEVGSSIRSWSPDRAQMWGDNVILECDPPRRLVHTWRSLYDPGMAAEPESRVTWEIGAQPGGFAKLTLIHDRLEAAPKTAASVRGWSYILSNLKTVVETGEALPPLVQPSEATGKSRDEPAGQQRAREAQMTRPFAGWFEITGKDGPALQLFYFKLFDWSINDAGNGCAYGLVEAGDKGNAGGIRASQDGAQGGVAFYIEVDDPAAFLDRAEKLPGTTVVVPPKEIHDCGLTFAFIADPDGHVVGLSRGALH